MGIDLSVTPIKGKVMRMISVDACGNPVSGSSLVVVSKGFIKVQVAPQYEDGAKQRVKLADGTLCVNDDDNDEFTNVQLTIDLCAVCPSMMQVAQGTRLLSAAGAGVTGTGAAYSEGPLTNRWSLELWQLVTGKNACDGTGAQRYVYWAWPNVGNGRMGSVTIENAALTMQIAAKTDAVGSNWKSVLNPTWLDSNVINSGDHMLWNITTVAPPAIPANCGSTVL